MRVLSAPARAPGAEGAVPHEGEVEEHGEVIDVLLGGPPEARDQLTHTEGNVTPWNSPAARSMLLAAACSGL